MKDLRFMKNLKLMNNLTFMKNLSVKNKLIVSFSVIFLMLLLIIITVTVSFSLINKNISEFNDRAFVAVQLADDLDLSINKFARDTLYAANDPNTMRAANKITNATSYLNKMLTTIESLRKVYPGEVAQFDDMVSDINTLMAIINKDKSTLTSTDTGASFEIYEEKMYPIVQGISELATEISEYEANVAQELYSKTKGYTYFTMFFVIIISIIAAAIGIFFAIYITKMLREGIEDIYNAATEMAKGNFDVSIQYKSSDEIGRIGIAIEELASNFKNVITDLDVILGEIAVGNLAVKFKNQKLYIGIFNSILVSLRKCVSKLSDTMLQIDAATLQVNSSAEQVSAGSQALSQGATEQASAIEQLSVTVNSIADMIATNANDAERVNENTSISGEHLAIAKNKIEELVNAMREIKDFSAQIEKINNTIEDMAFQTDILAVNAAIEAVKAGVAGKGFSVVADEVRELAARSSVAAHDTEELIGNTVDAIERGNKIVAEVVRDMDAVSESSEVVSVLNKRIAKDTKEASGAISQITLGIGQISAVVQANSNTSQQSAAESEELSAQAQMLQNMMEEFKFIR